MEQVVNEDEEAVVWHAGDWTGPVSLQPDITHSAEHLVEGDRLNDIVAVSEEGVKVITLMLDDIQRILKNGSKLFRKYTALEQDQRDRKFETEHAQQKFDEDPAASSDNLLKVIQCNSVLSNLSAKQKRHLESLAEGPRYFPAKTSLWKVGDPVDYAFLVVSGSATIGKKAAPKMNMGRMSRRGSR